MNKNFILILKNYLRLLDNAICQTENKMPDSLIKREKTFFNEETKKYELLNHIYDFRSYLLDDIEIMKNNL